VVAPAPQQRPEQAREVVAQKMVSVLKQKESQGPQRWSLVLVPLPALEPSFHRNELGLPPGWPVPRGEHSCTRLSEEHLLALLQLKWDSIASTVLRSIVSNRLKPLD
jgi:hypothetical protein